MRPKILVLRADYLVLYPRTHVDRGRSEPGALEDRFAIFAELRERIRTPLFVVLDEFQAVLAGVGEVDATIRSEIQHHDHVGYIFAGSHVGMMRELFADRSRPFYASVAAAPGSRGWTRSTSSPVRHLSKDREPCRKQPQAFV